MKCARYQMNSLAQSQPVGGVWLMQNWRSKIKGKAKRPWTNVKICYHFWYVFNKWVTPVVSYLYNIYKTPDGRYEWV